MMTLKEVFSRVLETKTFADIKSLFNEVFGLSDAQLTGACHIPGLPDEEAPVELTQAAKMANPKYDEGGGYANNCQRCAPAYELLRRGFKVSALPNNADNTGTSKRQYMNGSECFIGAVIHGYRYDESLPIDKPALKRALNLLPNGARVAIFWVNPDASRGHVIVAEKANGQLNFLDPQSGKIGPHTLGEASRENGYYWYRTDNLELDEHFEWHEIVGEWQ